MPDTLKKTIANFVAVIGTFGLMGALFFGGAGRFDLPFFWALLGLFAVFTIASLCFLDPGLLEERIRPESSGTDRSTVALITALFVVHLLLAGLDERFHWSPGLPIGLQVVSMVLCALGYGFTFLAMWTNKYFSPLISLQEKRGHHVINSGPYHFVRHPGYAGALIAFLAQGLALGSLWSMIPALVLCVVIVFRIPREEKFLLEKLDGYKDYTGSVRWRLIPGIW